jgi:glutamate-5-semialdehyde dehydrogenase
MTTQEILRAAKSASPSLRAAGSEKRGAAPCSLWPKPWKSTPGKFWPPMPHDLEAARGSVSEVMLDRLALSDERIAGMAGGIRQVAALPDPVGRVLRRVERPNGLVIEKTAVPMGLIAIIYESRPNVTSDAAALAIRSGNACVLRCGREAFRSAGAVVDAMREGLLAAGLPAELVSMVQDSSRASAAELMTAKGLVVC